MRKKLIATVGVTLLAVALTGCSGGDNRSQAMDLCVKAAEEEVGASIDTSDLKASNMGDALYEAGVTDEKETDDKDALFFVSGDVTYEADGKETRKSMICSVDFKGGKAGEPDLTLT